MTDDDNTETIISLVCVGVLTPLIAYLVYLISQLMELIIYFCLANQWTNWLWGVTILIILFILGLFLSTIGAIATITIVVLVGYTLFWILILLPIKTCKKIRKFFRKTLPTTSKEIK